MRNAQLAGFLVLSVHIHCGGREVPKMSLNIETEKIPNKLSFIFGLVGIILLAVAVFSYFHTWSFMSDSLTSDGTVIDFVYSDNAAYPTVRYQTQAGKFVEFTSNVGSNPPSFDKGELVEVYYNPENPREARIGTFFSLWGMVIIPGVLGLVFSFIPIIVYAVRSKTRFLLAP